MYHSSWYAAPFVFLAHFLQDARKHELDELPKVVRIVRTEPGAVQALAYLERYRTLSETHQSKHKARQILMTELRCSETFVKNLEKEKPR